MFAFAHLVLFELFFGIEVLPPTHILTLFLEASAEPMSSSAGRLAVGVHGADISEMSHVYSRPCLSQARYQIEPIDEGSVGRGVRMLRPVKRGCVP